MKLLFMIIILEGLVLANPTENQLDQRSCTPCDNPRLSTNCKFDDYGVSSMTNAPKYSITDAE